MAAFPLPSEFMYGFKFAPRSGVAMNESVSGTADTRNLYGTRRAGQWAGPMILTAAQVTSLIAHYEGDYANEFDFTDPETNDTFTVIYGDPGISQPVKVGPDAYAVTANLERVKLESTTDFLLLESGDSFLLENGDTLELESS